MDRMTLRWASESDTVKLGATFHAWTRAHNAHLREQALASQAAAIQRIEKFPKVALIMERITLRWDSEADAVKLKATFHAWTRAHIACLRKRTSDLKPSGSDVDVEVLALQALAVQALAIQRMGRSPRLRLIMDRVTLRWASEFDSEKLKATFHAWTRRTSNSRLEAFQARIGNNSRLENAMDKALLTWGSEADAVGMHVLIQCWFRLVAITRRQALEKCLSKDIRIRAALDKFASCWIVGGAHAQLLGAIFHTWSISALRDQTTKHAKAAAQGAAEVASLQAEMQKSKTQIESLRRSMDAAAESQAAASKSCCCVVQ